MQDLIDRRAIEDEHLYKLRMSTAYKGLSGLDEMQLLYAQVFVLENLGICIFTSSALLDNTEAFDLLAEMFTARTGAEMSGEKLIVQASRVMERERGFTEHRKRHEADIRVTHKGDWLILRIKDDCSPFDPTQRAAMLESEDGIANIGIHMVQRIAADMQYQSILGLNALTIKICMANREE